MSMESNGKGVSLDGSKLSFEAGEIDFGEPGTNGQHSFYQLIHQGRVVPCEFIGIVKSQQSVYLKVASHISGFPCWSLNRLYSSAGLGNLLPLSEALKKPLVSFDCPAFLHMQSVTLLKILLGTFSVADSAVDAVMP